MKKYEIMYILMPNLDDETKASKVAALEKILTDNGATNVSTKDWGMRELAYEIKKQTKGQYMLLTFESDAKAINEFDKKVRLDSMVMRFLVTVAE